MTNHVRPVPANVALPVHMSRHPMNPPFVSGSGKLRQQLVRPLLDLIPRRHIGGSQLVESEQMFGERKWFL